MSQEARLSYEHRREGGRETDTIFVWLDDRHDEYVEWQRDHSGWRAEASMGDDPGPEPIKPRPVAMLNRMQQNELLRIILRGPIGHTGPMGAPGVSA